MKKNYYNLLGISPDESEEGIRSAYRRKAKLYHPDRAGTEGKARFQDIAEAYDVLSHPEKKRHYDDELKTERHASAPEPLIPKHPSGFPHASHHRRKTPFQEVFEEVCSGLDMNGFAGASGEAFVIKVILSEEEAWRGCILKFGLDVPGSCPVCSGTGSACVPFCRSCEGTGRVYDRLPLRIRIPAHVEHGSVLELPLALYGCDRLLRLCVHVRPSQ